jgi:hypothetical protein
MINRCDAAFSSSLLQLEDILFFSSLPFSSLLQLSSPARGQRLMAYDFLSLIASDCLPHQVTPPPLEHGFALLDGLQWPASSSLIASLIR